MAASNKSEAREMARDIINAWSIGSFSVAWIPGSNYAIGSGDLSMTIKVGSLFGIELDRAQAAQVFTSVAAPLINSNTAHSILDFIPILGWAVKPVVAFGATERVGIALINYFNNRSNLPE